MSTVTPVAGDVAFAGALAQELERDGYCVVPGFFRVDEVRQARAEIVAVLERDRAAREAAGEKAEVWGGGPTYWSSLTSVMHSLMFPSVHCPTLARMLADLLDSPLAASLLKRALGDHYRLRAELCRQNTGALDEGRDGDLPHAWHRDPPGIFTIGIYFDDLSQDGDSATAGLPGTHMLAPDPYWDFMLSRPCYRSLDAYLATSHRYILEWFFNHNLFQGAVRRRFQARGRGMLGRAGDWYFFFNQVWHGRQPNLRGKRLVTVRFGGYATDPEFAYREDTPVPAWPAHVSASYSERFRPGKPVNAGTASIIQRMRRSQLRPRLDLFTLARLEKRLLAYLCGKLMTWYPQLDAPEHRAAPR